MVSSCFNKIPVLLYLNLLSFQHSLLVNVFSVSQLGSNMSNSSRNWVPVQSVGIKSLVIIMGYFVVNPAKASSNGLFKMLKDMPVIALMLLLDVK